MNVLVVEDDEGISVPLCEGLQRHGFSTQAVASGAAALQASGFDVVLLDLGLPDMDGLDVCRELRAASAVPILVVSARGEETDRVVGLELGADDYLVKPFGLRELVARIRAVGRRVNIPTEGAFSVAENHQNIGPLEIQRRNRRVLVDGYEVALTPKEFDLLALLAEEPGVVVTRQQLLEEVWDPHWYGPTKTIDVHVATLRK